MSDDASIRHALETSVNPQGRVTIPAQVRREAGISVGSALVVYVDDGRVVLETREQLAARIQREVRGAWRGTESAADDLIADRRAEARHDGT